MDSQRDEQHVHLIVSHRIWCPQRRKEVLVHQIGKRCAALIRQQGDEQGWTLLEVAVPPEHLQRFVRVWPSVRAAEVVKDWKGCSAFTRRKAFPALHRLPSWWTRSSFVSTAGTVSSAIIQRSSAAPSRQ